VPRGGPTHPPESRNGGTVTYHPWQRNETHGAILKVPDGASEMDTAGYWGLIKGV
jgi:hypothetical protein